MFPSRAAAASLVPSLDDVMPYQYRLLPEGSTSVHVSPESVDVQILPPSTVAASFVPSLDIVMPRQTRVLALDVHVSPESVDVQMFPLKTVAASLVPSLDDVMPAHICVLALDVQVSPESVDVQMFPVQSTAASLVPSLDDVIATQSCVLALDVHVEALTEASEANESNAASRTRSIRQHFVLLVSCRPFLRVSRNSKMTLSRQFSLRSARSGVQQGQTGSIWARAARFHSSFALEIVMGRAQMHVQKNFHGYTKSLKRVQPRNP